MREHLRGLCMQTLEKWGGTLIECNGEADHMHLLLDVAFFSQRPRQHGILCVEQIFFGLIDTALGSMHHLGIDLFPAMDRRTGQKHDVRRAALQERLRHPIRGEQMLEALPFGLVRVAWPAIRIHDMRLMQGQVEVSRRIEASHCPLAEGSKALWRNLIAFWTRLHDVDG